VTNTSLAHGYLIKERARLKTLPVLMGEQVLRPRPYGPPGWSRPAVGPVATIISNAHGNAGILGIATPRPPVGQKGSPPVRAARSSCGMITERR
jgi:hypothetical protein